MTCEFRELDLAALPDWLRASRPSEVAGSPGRTATCDRTSAPSLQQAHCAIVSSDGSLADSGCGKHIDDAGVVWRMNNPPIFGHEGDVGSRTDVHVLGIMWNFMLTHNESKIGDARRRCFERDANATVLFTYGGLRTPRMPDYAARTVAWACALGGGPSVPTCSSVHHTARRPDWSVTFARSHFMAQLDRWLGNASKRHRGLFAERTPFRGQPGAITASAGLKATAVAGALCRSVRLYGFREYVGAYHFFEPRAAGRSDDHKGRPPRRYDSSLEWGTAERWGSHHLPLEHHLMDSWARVRGG
jgi:hypothetical protein